MGSQDGRPNCGVDFFGSQREEALDLRDIFQQIPQRHWRLPAFAVLSCSFKFSAAPAIIEMTRARVSTPQ
jgi:hypothetical protein